MNRKESNINDIINSLSIKDKKPMDEILTEDPAEPGNETETMVLPEESELAGDCSLWIEFINRLGDEEQENECCKMYQIDDDIIFTLQQCDFGKSNKQIINTVLRVFLIDNIENLKRYIVRRKSLFDKFNNG